MADDAPKRFTLLYQLYLTNQAARRFMRSALSGTGMSGEEFALLSYLYGNGPRTLSQAARDFGLAITTVATMLAPLLDAGELERIPHPKDRRARLIRITESGRSRMDTAIPRYTEAYQLLLRQLDGLGQDPEAIFTSLDRLRTGMVETIDRLEADRVRSA